MKKIFMMMAVAVAMLGLSSCGGPKLDTPEDTISSLEEAIKDLDVENVVACIGDKDGNPLPDEVADWVKSSKDLAFYYLDDDQQDLVKEYLEDLSIEVKGEPKYNKDEDKAKVKLVIKYKDFSENETVQMAKGDDDCWRIALPFTEKQLKKQIDQSFDQFEKMMDGKNSYYDYDYDYNSGYGYYDDDYDYDYYESSASSSYYY